jgi:hypothetical protein
MPAIHAGKYFAGIAGLVISSAIACAVFWAPFETDAGDDRRVPASVSSGLERKAADVFWRKRRVYDPFPPLVRFQVVTAQEAGPAINEDEFVVGVEADGDARAYPLNMLGHPGSEVVNDTLGGRPVAVTFCGLCETPLVFSRRVDERTLTFFVSGLVVESNMVIQDVETRSAWIQLLGKAVDGPLTGKELDQISSIWTDWKTWRTKHPETTVVLLKRGSKKYSQAAIGTASAKQRALGALQWGLARDGKARSWPFAHLARRRVVNDSFAGTPLLLMFDPERLSPTAFDRRQGGRELTFRLRGTELIDETTGSVWDPVTGQALHGPLEGQRLSPVSGTIATAPTWLVFHPDGEVWSAGEP